MARTDRLDGNDRVGRVTRILGGLAWFLAVLVVAVGAAGLVTELDQGTPVGSRGELTSAGDARVTPVLDAAESDLRALADDVDALGTAARRGLAAINGADMAAVEAAVADGDELMSAIVARTDGLRRALGAVPEIGTPTAGLHISQAVIDRHAALVGALDATDGLDAAWSRLTVGSVAAARMSALLAEHDRLVGRAADRGVNARYAQAIDLLDEAGEQLADARTLRDQLAATVDVTVLDEWLDRNEAYDAALRNLYVAISKVGRRVTAATRKAVEAEAEARARLPSDARGLVVIMAEIGRGAMTSAVITIEEARARLSDAVDTGAAVPADEPAAGEGP